MCLFIISFTFSLNEGFADCNSWGCIISAVTSTSNFQIFVNMFSIYSIGYNIYIVLHCIVLYCPVCDCAYKACLHTNTVSVFLSGLSLYVCDFECLHVCVCMCVPHRATDVAVNLAQAQEVTSKHSQLLCLSSVAILTHFHSEIHTYN